MAIPLIEIQGKKIKVRKFLSSQERNDMNLTIQQKKVLIFMKPPNSNTTTLEGVKRFLESQFGPIEGIISSKHLATDSQSACITATFKSTKDSQICVKASGGRFINEEFGQLCNLKFLKFPRVSKRSQNQGQKQQSYPNTQCTQKISDHRQLNMQGFYGERENPNFLLQSLGGQYSQAQPSQSPIRDNILHPGYTLPVRSHPFDQRSQLLDSNSLRHIVRRQDHYDNLDYLRFNRAPFSQSQRLQAAREDEAGSQVIFQRRRENKL